METLEYYQNALQQYTEALESEKQHDLENESMINLLRHEISLCNKYIKELSWGQ
jgi:hypothetical protein|tara:strand:+ start:598 stop:759 length:162 start_codon:yes stop_codon:yes gene_type:complete